MRTASFKSVLEGSAGRLGLSPAELLGDQAAALGRYISGRVRDAWEMHNWPFSRVIEERVFAPKWDAETVYVAGDIVYFEGQYYSAKTDGLTVTSPVQMVVADAGTSSRNGIYNKFADGVYRKVNPTTSRITLFEGLYYIADYLGNPYDVNGYYSTTEDVATPDLVKVWNVALLGAAPVPTVVRTVNLLNWSLVTLGTRVVYTQATDTAIGEVLNVWAENPLLNSQQLPLDFELTADGALIRDSSADSVWVEFSKIAPVFSSTPWDAGASYSVGDVVYYNGECYLAAAVSAGVVPGTSAVWTLQQLPHQLARFAEVGAVADALEEAGLYDKAARTEARADELLTDELEKLLSKQNQTPGFSVRTA